jgi:uncharacterized protein
VTGIGLGVPEIPEDEVTHEFWDATRERRLVIQRCQDCGHWQHYPRALCIGCGGTSLGFATASGEGEIDTYTEVMRSIRPDVPTPYVVARVKLAEGPILLTRLIDPGRLPADHSDSRSPAEPLATAASGGELIGSLPSAPSRGGLIGRAVTVAWEPLRDGRHLPVFQLRERSSLWTLP